MGIIFNACKRKRNAVAESAALAEEELYLPGSLAYLDLVGMDAHGKLQHDKLESKEQRPENLKAVFNDYCAEFLELDDTA